MLKRKEQITLKIKIQQKMTISEKMSDKISKTKLSIHTKFKQMYGEYYEIGTLEYTKHTIDMTHQIGFR